MRPLDISIAVATLELNPDPKKAEMLCEEVQRALQRHEISAQIYAETLALLKKASGPSLCPTPGAT